MFIKPESVARLALLAMAISAPLLWLLTRAVNNIPGANIWSLWFFLATPFLVESAIRLRRSRWLPLGGALIIVGYLSRAAAGLWGYLDGPSEYPLSQVLLGMTMWISLSIYSGVIIYWIARVVVNRTES
jgi:hypothetical protein